MFSFVCVVQVVWISVPSVDVGSGSVERESFLCFAPPDLIPVSFVVSDRAGSTFVDMEFVVITEDRDVEFEIEGCLIGGYLGDPGVWPCRSDFLFREESKCARRRAATGCRRGRDRERGK